MRQPSIPFFAEVLRKTGICRDASVLVVCGGEFDRDVLQDSGFTNVTISNLDERVRGDEFAPFAWSYQDAETLALPGGSFDYVMVHAGLHHCASPHKALLEMYRVARKGILVIEARDSILMRAAIAAGRVPSYEAAAVRAHKFRYGGVRNSSTPNFIYRWTESEVRKTIASYAPQAAHSIIFFYGLRVPSERIPFRSSRMLRWLSPVVEQGVRVTARLWRSQGNQFGFYILKPTEDQLFPWMKSFTEYNPDYRGI
jgi:SAM-dependent methyltransferase